MNFIQQEPDEALQTYNSQYKSHFNWHTQTSQLMTLDPGHYASSLHGKLGGEMEGRFNQDLPESLQTTFEKAMNFEPHILTKQTIHTRRMNEVNQIDVTHYDEKLEVNEAHI